MYVVGAHSLELHAINENCLLFNGACNFGKGFAQDNERPELDAIVGINRTDTVLIQACEAEGIARPEFEAPGWFRLHNREDQKTYALNGFFRDEQYKEVMGWVLPISEREDWRFRCVAYFDDFDKQRGATSEDDFLSGKPLVVDTLHFHAEKIEANE